MSRTFHVALVSGIQSICLFLVVFYTELRILDPLICKW